MKRFVVTCCLLTVGTASDARAQPAGPDRPTAPAKAAGTPGDKAKAADPAPPRPPAPRPDARPAARRAARPAAAERARPKASEKLVQPRPEPKIKTRFRWTLEFDLEGYYSATGIYIKDLAKLKQSTLPGATSGVYRERLTNTGYFMHHLRFEPRLSLGKLATLYVRLDGLQHVVWGDNDARASSSLFAGNPTNTNDYGESVSSIQLTHAYLDVDVILGRLRIGRMPSHWGMGLLSNGGGNLMTHRGGVDDDFADNRHPSIMDRILFATKPISVIKTIAKKKDTSSNFILAYAYDRLVEEPYWRDIDQEWQRAYGEQSFLSRQQNNVEEHVLVLAYSNKKFLAGHPVFKKWKNELVVGAYVVYRKMGAYDGTIRYFDGARYVAYDCAGSDPPPACGAASKVGIIDPYVKLRLGPFLLESESYFIIGKTEPGKGIPIGDNVGKAFIYAWVARLGAMFKKWNVLLDVGQASGDDALADETFRQRPMHPDFGVGLILYREFLRERSATALAQRLNSNVGGSLTPARSLQSNGGVLNSYFIYPRVLWHVSDKLTLKLAVLTAISHQQDDQDFLFVRGRGKHIGTEIDIGVDFKWGGPLGREHLMFRLDMGYLIFGDQVKDDYDSPGIFALRARLMMVF